MLYYASQNSHSKFEELFFKCSLNNDDVKVFIISSIENAGSSSIPYIRAAYETFLDLEKLQYLDSLLNASLLNHVANRASKQQGKAFLTTSSKVFPYDEIRKLAEFLEEGNINGHLAIVFPVVCAALKIPILTVGQMFLFNTLRTLIASIVRLGKIGAVQAQEYQFEIQNLLNVVLERCWHILPEDSHVSFPVPETVQNLHDTMFSKLFYS